MSALFLLLTATRLLRYGTNRKWCIWEKKKKSLNLNKIDQSSGRFNYDNPYFTALVAALMQELRDKLVIRYLNKPEGKLVQASSTRKEECVMFWSSIKSLRNRILQAKSSSCLVSVWSRNTRVQVVQLHKLTSFLPSLVISSGLTRTTNSDEVYWFCLKINPLIVRWFP